MKHVLVAVTMIFYIQLTMAQNLVPNPNFALFYSCPTDYAQIEKCMYWYNPTGYNTSYFNSCTDTVAGSLHTVSVPSNYRGTQSSTSNAYIGIHTYSGIASAANMREYAGTNIPALIPGATYRVLLKISLGDYCAYATNAPSVLFFKDIDTFVSSTSYVLPFAPQITFNIAGHITDKVNWVTVVDTFIADSAYKHLMIGNFNNDTFTTKTNIPSSSAMISFFYVDSISVEKIADPSIVNPNVVGIITATLYPNPFTEQAMLRVENLPPGTNTLSIVNSQGAIVKKIGNIQPGQTVISREGLAPGFYYYVLQNGMGVVYRDKLVIQ